MLIILILHKPVQFHHQSSIFKRVRTDVRTQWWTGKRTVAKYQDVNFQNRLEFLQIGQTIDL